MNCCDKYFDSLNMLADGELPEEAKAELMAHLDTCPDCRRIYEGIIFISEAVQDDIEEVPDGLHEKIMSGVKAASRAKRRKRITTWVGSIAACLVVLVGASSMLSSPKSAQSAASTGFAAPEAPMMMAAAADDSSAVTEFEPAEAEEAHEVPYGFSAEEKSMAMNSMTAENWDAGSGAAMEPVYIDDIEGLVNFVDSLLNEADDTLDTEIIFNEKTFSFTMREGELFCSAEGESAKICNTEDIIRFMEGLK